MRLIDADTLIDKMFISHIAHSKNSRDASLLNRDVRIVMEQPTAYDVEKVLEEVDEFEIRCCDCQESCNTYGCLIERIKNVISNGGKE